MNRSETRSPPIVTLTEIRSGRGCSVAGVTILNQIYPLEPTMPASKRSQSFRVMTRVLGLQKSHCHLTRVNHQKHQHVDGAMPSVIKLLPFHRTRNGAPERFAFQHLEVGDLIDTNHPQALRGQISGISVTPQHFLRPRLEFGIQLS